MAVSSRATASEESVRYYILRKPENTMVPLIPADQLPFHIQGVPQNLTHRQMSDERWTFVDETYEPATVLPLVSTKATNAHPLTPPFTPTRSKFRAPDHDVRTGVYDTPSQHSPHTPRSDVGRRPTPRNRPQSLSDSLAALYPQDAQRLGYRPAHSTPSGVQPDPSKKVYCTHWIATGECNFTAQGCKYKHEMPPTQEELLKIGFKQVPKWYKEKQALDRQGPTWMQLQQKKKQQREDDNGENEDSLSEVSMSPDLPSQKLMKFEDIIRRTRTTASKQNGRSTRPRTPPLSPRTPESAQKFIDASKLHKTTAHNNTHENLIDIDDELDRPLTPASPQSAALSSTTAPSSIEHTPITKEEPAVSPKDSAALLRRSSHASASSMDDSPTKTAKRQLAARKVYPSISNVKSSKNAVIATVTSTHDTPPPTAPEAIIPTPKQARPGSGGLALTQYARGSLENAAGGHGGGMTSSRRAPGAEKKAGTV